LIFHPTISICSGNQDFDAREPSGKILRTSRYISGRPAKHAFVIGPPLLGAGGVEQDII